MNDADPYDDFDPALWPADIGDDNDDDASDLFAAAEAIEKGELPPYCYDAAVFAERAFGGDARYFCDLPAKAGRYVLPAGPLRPGVTARPDAEGGPCPYGSGIGNAQVDQSRLSTHSIEIDAERPADGRSACALFAAQLRAVAAAIAETEAPMPAVVVCSGWPCRDDPLTELGRSIHLYWCLDAPHTDLADWQRCQRALVSVFAADPANATAPAKRHRAGGVVAERISFGRVKARRRQPILWCGEGAPTELDRTLAWAAEHAPPAPIEVGAKPLAGSPAPPAANPIVKSTQAKLAPLVADLAALTDSLTLADGRIVSLAEAKVYAPRVYETDDRWRVRCPNPRHHPDGSPDQNANALAAVDRHRSLYVHCPRCATTWKFGRTC